MALPKKFWILIPICSAMCQFDPICMGKWWVCWSINWDFTASSGNHGREIPFSKWMVLMGKSRWPLWAASDPLVKKWWPLSTAAIGPGATSDFRRNLLNYHGFTRRFLLLMSMFLICLSICWWLLHHISPYIAIYVSYMYHVLSLMIMCGPFFCCNPSHLHMFITFFQKLTSG